MRSKPCATTTLTPSKRVPLAAQSRELPVPYSRPARTMSGCSFRRISRRRRRCSSVRRRLEPGHAAFHARGHQVLDADVGESAARHNAVVAAAGAVAVEVHKVHAILNEVFAGRGSFLDAAGWGNVVGGDESPKMPRGRAPLISARTPGCRLKLSKKGGSWM